MTKNQPAITRQDLSSMAKSIVTDISSVVDDLMVRIDERFDRIETEQAKMRVEIQQILNSLDSIEKQLEISEDERLIMGHQLERLDKWVHELAEHIGFKLSS
jgi:chromosome segregation ATPase